MSTRVEIRLPKGLRIYIVVVGTVWCLGFLSGIVAGLVTGNAAVLIIVPFVALGATFFVRQYGLGAVADGDELVVRNWFKTIRLARREIEDFRVGPSPFFYFLGKTIYALVRDRTVVSLEVTARPQITSAARTRQAVRLAELQAWLSSSTPSRPDT